VINATTQRAFVKLCDAIGQPGLVSDERFTPRGNLLKNHAAIHAILAEWVGARTLAECQGTLDRFGVPATKVYLMEDIVGDPHYAARHQVVSVETPDHGHLLQPGVVPVLTGTPGRIAGRAPALGEHNDEVFTGLLGMSAAELEGLRERGLV
jgi:crotonobetainyl-CoA:carnitine CoA-transferase CaiB-like acyl-CoA transferase